MGLFDIFKTKKKIPKCVVCNLDIDRGIKCPKCENLVHKKCMKKYKRSLICKKCFKKEKKSKKKIERAYWNIKNLRK